VELCAERHHPYAMGPRVLIALFIAGAVLWGASGRIARRLSLPIVEVARVAEEIGSGKHGSRVQLRRRRQHGEVHALAVAINTMAERIEKQFKDQRELLAAVSHEIRTPLARIRLLLELARENGVEGPLEKSFDEIDREVVEMDALVSELLASSRVDFAALTKKTLDARDVARRALERASVAATALVVEANSEGSVPFAADATLMARALANLIENAERHGAGMTALRVRVTEAAVAFEAEDHGPGFAAGEGERAFDPFYRGGGAKDGERPSLGLGLALVRRIAEAHGGLAYVRAREGGGAVVGIELPR
jgi:two-component system OmpR family sensor kinase